MLHSRAGQLRAGRTTPVVIADGRSTPRRLSVLLLCALVLSTLACKKIASMRANPESMCKRMTTWEDTPGADQAQCEAALEKQKTDNPEVYSCMKQCVPQSDSRVAMGTCMKGCAPSGAVASKPEKKKRAFHSVFLRAPKLGSSGACSVSLSLDGFEDRRGSGSCSYDAKQNAFDVTVKLSKGQSIKLGGQAANFENGEVTLTQKLGDEIASAKTDSLTVEIPLELTDDNGTWKGTFNLLHGTVTQALMSIEKGPVLFGGESAGGGGTASLLLIGGYTPKHHGKVVALKELDLLAVAKSKTRSFSRCNYSKGGKRKSLSRTAFDKQVTVYDRRTGKRLGSKLIKAATPSCPTYAKDSDYTVSKHVSLDSCFAFAKTFVH